MYNPTWRQRTHSSWGHGIHSSQGQDLFVRDVLCGLRGGFFLDSGAGDGTNGSNTKLLEEEYGWSGICLEPNAELFDRLRTSRHCMCLNCCLYSRDENVYFLEGARELGGIVEAFEPEDLARAQIVAALLKNGHRPAVVEREARRPLTVLQQAGAPEVIDYWSLDTEGSELAILECFPFESYRVRVLTVEHNYGRARESIYALLHARGYDRVAHLAIDDGYVLRNELRCH
jgi:Methyltransferase FkbM domain